MFYEISENQKKPQNRKLDLKGINSSLVRRFAGYSCSATFDQFIFPSKNEKMLYIGPRKEQENQPQNIQTTESKKISFMSVQTRESKPAQKKSQKKLKNSRLGFKVTKSQKATRPKSTYFNNLSKCVPLVQSNYDMLQKTTFQAIDILRGIKEREKQLEEKEKDKKQNLKIEQQKIRSIIGQKSQLARRTPLTFGFEGNAIPINLSQDISLNRFSSVEVKFSIFEQDEQVEKSIHSNGKVKRFRKNKPTQISNKIRAVSQNTKPENTLQFYSLENSQFFRNFMNLKLNPQVKVGTEFQQLQQRKSILVKKPAMSHSKSISTIDSQVIPKSNLNIIDKGLFTKQFLQQKALSFYKFKQLKKAKSLLNASCNKTNKKICFVED